MELSSPSASVFCPGGVPAQAAFRSTRALGVVAHADDLEIAAIKGILDYYGAAEPGFSGVVVCDGVGAPGQGAQLLDGDREYARIRRAEQERAATLGRYASVICLGHSSASVRAREPSVGTDLAQLFRWMSPEIVYTHNPVDAHDTHVAVVLELIRALQLCPRERRPAKVIGCEVWRDLDWLPEAHRVSLDVGAEPALQRRLLQVFASQTAAKRYDVGALGRRQAHATFRLADQADQASGIVFGVDLTSLLEPGAPSVEEFSLGLLDAFRQDVVARFARLRGPE